MKLRISSRRKPSIAIAMVFVLFLGLFFIISREKVFVPASFTESGSKISMSFHTNIIKDAQENIDFRQVLFTGKNSQLVIMSIPPGGEVGAETHKYTEQTLFFLSGTGEGELNHKTFPIGPGDVVVVVPGTEHNFRNTGTQSLKIYTVYAPPNHLDGLTEKTKADADANTADEAVGETAPK